MKHVDTTDEPLHAEDATETQSEAFASEGAGNQLQSESPVNSDQDQSQDNPEAPSVDSSPDLFGVVSPEPLPVQSPERAEQPSQRSKHIEHIRAYATEIIREVGSDLLTAKTVFQGLRERGHALTVKGVPMKDCKAIADAMGGHGLKLPSVMIGGTKWYRMDMIDATSEEKAAALEALREHLSTPRPEVDSE